MTHGASETTIATFSTFAAFDDMPAQVAVLDATGVILFVNAAWEAFARENGYAGRAFVGVNYLDTCLRVSGVEADQAYAFAAGVKAVVSGARLHFDMIYPCHAPREKRWFKGFVFRHGDLIAVMHVDISREYEEFARLSGFLSRAELVHDLRSPLNIILGFSQLGRTLDADEADKIKDSFEMIRRAGERMLELVNDLLDYARGVASGREVREHVVDLPELLRGIADECRILAHNAQVTLNVAVPADLLLLGSAKELRKLFTNLIANAIKYNRKGGQVDVSAALNAAGGIEVRVADTGIGISDEERAAVFEPFHRVAAPEAQGREGTGLGLPIAQDVARRHDGDIALDSTPGQGSAFTVRFPTWRTRRAVTPASAPNKKPTT